MKQREKPIKEITEIVLGAVCWIIIIATITICIEVTSLIQDFFRAKHPKVESIHYVVESDFIDDLEMAIGNRDRNYSEILDDIEQIIEQEKFRQIEEYKSKEEEFREKEADRYVW